MPFILPANTTSVGAYSIANSCRFDDGSSTRMTKTPGSDGDLDNWTFSCWVKRGNITTGTAQCIFSCDVDSSTNYGKLVFDTSDRIEFHNSTGGVVDKLITNRVFRDCSAWLHIVVVWDSDNGTEAQRMRLYVNGTEESSFNTANYPTSGLNSAWNQDSVHSIGDYNSGQYFDGYIAEAVFTDGQVYAASDFGEFDTDNSPNIWKPKDVSGLTFGGNGAYLDFEDSGNLGDDESGNGNDWSETNIAAADQATDSPTNNFCTLNNLDNYYAGSTFSEGNCKIVGHSSRSSYNTGTIGLSAGKWYFEVKQGVVAGTGSEYYAHVGIETIPSTSTSNSAGINTYSSNYSSYDGDHYHDTGVSGDNDDFGDTYTDGDIVSVALDLDNNRVYYAKNGTWQNSQDPTDGTNALTITAPASTDSGVYFPAIGDRTAAKYYTWEANFGGCSGFAVSSGNADDNGYGDFEYDVPAGYLAICTKNLGSDGG